MGALLALIPTKDWFYGALVVGIAVLGWHFYDKYTDAVNYAATVKAESKTALDTANQQIKDLTADYAAREAQNKDTYDKAIQAAALQHASDTERLRALSSARSTDPVLQGSAGLSAAIAAWSARLGRLESISAGLADAVRADDAAAVQCWADRDALTGK